MDNLSRKVDKEMQNRIVVAMSILCMLVLSGCPKKVSPVGAPSAAKKSDQTPKSESFPTEVVEDGIQPVEPLVASLNEEALPPPSTDTTASLPSTPKEVPLDDIFFEFGQWTVRSEDQPRLLKNATWLTEHPEIKVAVEGHADKRGTNEYNLVLAEKRAEAVQEYLVQFGIPSSRVLVMSYGEERPFCSTDDDTCFQQNRRAHFHAE